MRSFLDHLKKIGRLLPQAHFCRGANFDFRECHSIPETELMKNHNLVAQGFHVMRVNCLLRLRLKVDLGLNHAVR